MSNTPSRTDFGFSKYSPKELDAIMIERNGVLGEGSDDKIPHCNPEMIRHGWRCQVVGRTESPTSGKLILIPTNQQTARTWREGKAIWFVSFGLTKEHAEAIIRDHETPYRFEEGVARAVAELIESGLNTGTLRGIYTAGRPWKARTGLRIELPYYDVLSRRRQESAVVLACLKAPAGDSVVKLIA